MPTSWQEAMLSGSYDLDPLPGEYGGMDTTANPLSLSMSSTGGLLGTFSNDYVTDTPLWLRQREERYNSLRSASLSPVMCRRLTGTLRPASELCEDDWNNLLGTSSLWDMDVGKDYL